MLEHAIPAPDPGPPPFTAHQRNGIRRIARQFRYPPHERWDFVHETWLRVHKHWIRVPRVEPSMRRYVFRLARNLAIDLLERFEDDAMTGAVVFSCLPEWAREDEDEADGEDRPGTPEVGRLSMENRILARQLWARALQLDPEGADWLARNRVEGATGPEIAAEVGKTVSCIHTRVSRLAARLRKHANEKDPDADEQEPPSPGA